MKPLFFLFLILAISVSMITVTLQDSYGLSSGKNYGISDQQVGLNNKVLGIQTEIETSDIFMNDTECDLNTIAVATQWIRFDGYTWIESGITAGKLTTTTGCQYNVVHYAGISQLADINDPTTKYYNDYKADTGVVGDKIFLEIQDTDDDNRWQVKIGEGFAKYGFTPNRNEQTEQWVRINYGIESRIEPQEDYSNIPNTQFTNLKYHVNGDWTTSSYFPASANHEDYLLNKCNSEQWVAGNVRSIDCDRSTDTNSSPTISDIQIDDTTDPYVKQVTVTATDVDYDYLTFYIEQQPSKGDMVMNGNIIDQPYEMEDLNADDHDNLTLIFDYESNAQETDNVVIYVTDQRTGHAVSETITLFENVVQENVAFTWEFDDAVSNKIIVTFDQPMFLDETAWDWRLYAATTSGASLTEYSITSASGYSIASQFYNLYYESSFPSEPVEIKLEYVGGNLTDDEDEYVLEAGTSHTKYYSYSGGGGTGSTLTEFTDDFEDDDLPNWSMSGDKDWFKGGINVSGSGKVSSTQMSSNDCNTVCIVTMNDEIDLTQTTNQQLEFYVFGFLLDSDDYLDVEYSTNGGSTWNNLYTIDTTSNKWIKKTIDLSSYSSSDSFKIRFLAYSNDGIEYISIDELSITGTEIDSTAPVISFTSPFDGQIFDTDSVTVTGVVTDSESTITDVTIQLNSDPKITITENFSHSFTGLSDGVYLVTISATNDQTLQSTGYIAFEVNLPDTTPPTFDVSGKAANFDTNLEFGATYNLGIIQNIVDAQSTTSSITDSSSINDTTPAIGEYTVYYIVTETGGSLLSTTIIETVTVSDNTAPIITLTGDNPQTIELGNDYTELGATTDDGSQVTIDDSAFVNALGSYFILYDSVDAAGNKAETATRTVNVVADVTAPVITFLGIDTVQVIQNDPYVDAGATCTDESDGDIPVTVGGLPIDTAIVGTYQVTYDCADTAENAADQLTRTVIVTDLIEPPGKIPYINVSKDSNSITIEWGEAEGFPTHYYIKGSGSSLDPVSIEADKDRTHTFVGSFKRLMITVIAVNDGGDGPTKVKFIRGNYGISP